MHSIEGEKAEGHFLLYFLGLTGKITKEMNDKNMKYCSKDYNILFFCMSGYVYHLKYILRS